MEVTLNSNHGTLHNRFDKQEVLCSGIVITANLLASKSLPQIYRMNVFNYQNDDIMSMMHCFQRMVPGKCLTSLVFLFLTLQKLYPSYSRLLRLFIIIAKELTRQPLAIQ